MDLALFDFDGTISTRDSFLGFMRYSSTARFYLGCAVLSPRIFLFLLKKYPNHNLKEAFLVRLFRHRPVENVEKLCRDYCRKVVPGIIRQGAIQAIEDHKKNGNCVVVVTATPRIILAPWCLAHGLDMIGTELETDARGRLTGRIDGENCRGEEKVRRITQSYNLADYTSVWAYGDTSGDLPMLGMAAADRRFYKPFRE